MMKKPKARKPRSKTNSTADVSLKSQLLEAALPDVAFDGWTDELLSRAAARLNLSPDALAEILPGGVEELARHLSAWADEKTLAKMPAAKMEKLRMRDRITLGVTARLEVLAPYKAATGSALAYLAKPPRGRHLPKMVWSTADAIWRRAGDTATDYNHYTKRLLLSGVLTSTILFWLNDDSEGYARTLKFLDQRIDNVLKIGGLMAKAKNKVGAKAPDKNA